MSLTPTEPVAGAAAGAVVTAGVDWSNTNHAVCVIDARGVVVHRFAVDHDKKGLARLVAQLHRDHVHEVGIERGDGAVVEALLDAGFTVLVIAPAQVKNLRSRYGSAGNKDDRFDAFVLADTVRTDRHRLTPLTRPSAASVVLRDTVRARKDLISARVATANQLLAHLQRVLPGAIGLFRDLDSPISLDFLDTFPTQVQADTLDEASLTAWLGAHHYPRSRAGKLLAHLHAATAGLSAPGARDHAAAHAAITRSYVHVLHALAAQIRTLEDSITTQHRHHRDRALFAALPHAATLRQARLLAEIGDARGRFPTPQSLACLAGVVPSTRQSGKTKIVAFRWGVDRHLRDAICDFAGDSRFSDPWAANYYNRARDRGHDHNHAVRILARAWVHILWHCWHDNTPYDPERHNARRHLTNTQNQQAA